MEKRKSLVIGNWKSNGSVKFVRDISNEVLNKIQYDEEKLSVLIAPMIIHIPAAKAMLFNHISVCSQNVSQYANGAYTGEVSAEQLKDFGINYTLIGHSERRMKLNETDEVVGAKVKRAQDGGIVAVICVGEQIEDRENGNNNEIIRT